MWVDAGPGPAGHLPAFGFEAEGGGDLAFLFDWLAVFVVEVDGGEDDVSYLSLDFDAGGVGSGDFAVGDAGGFGVLVVVGGP